MKAINDILEEKNRAINLYKWQIEKLEKENAELKEKNEALENDVKMYQENEENKPYKIGFNQGE